MSHLKYHNKLIELTEVFYESHCELITSVCIELGHPDKIKELQATLLDKMKLKAKKDPDRPRKAKTSYMYFCNANRENILKECPNMLLGDQSKKLGHLWNSLNELEKNAPLPYEYYDLAYLSYIYCDELAKDLGIYPKTKKLFSHWWRVPYHDEWAGF